MYNKQNALKDVADYWRKVKSGELPAPSPNDIDFTIWTSEAAIRRIAELESCSRLEYTRRVERENAELKAKLATPVLLPEKFSMLHRTDFHEDYHSTMAFKSVEVFDAIRAAGFTFTVGDE
ncbi:hypothetical protein [Serratia liquefaciens]|uniref:hypothetical protein n=1 Tax=Serratia liquefaciens TaxID=614 RepID=UPI001F3A9B47|nr:hypothetical protein [Serratia liquefaciens]MCE9941747.1 hypothetical protein [Serratia liquefaciens]